MREGEPRSEPLAESPLSKLSTDELGALIRRTVLWQLRAPGENKKPKLMPDLIAGENGDLIQAWLRRWTSEPDARHALETMLAAEQGQYFAPFAPFDGIARMTMKKN